MTVYSWVEMESFTWQRTPLGIILEMPGKCKIKRSLVIQVHKLHISLELHSPPKELPESSFTTAVLLNTDVESNAWLAICEKP